VKRLETTIKLEYDDENTAAAVADAVSPDNLKAPSGLFIETTCEGCCVITVIRGEVKLSTFISTVDDLLSSVSIAEKALGVVKSC
jgi:hypothetical protein